MFNYWSSWQCSIIGPVGNVRKYTDTSISNIIPLVSLQFSLAFSLESFRGFSGYVSAYIFWSVGVHVSIMQVARYNLLHLVISHIQTFFVALLASHHQVESRAAPQSDLELGVVLSCSTKIHIL